MKIDIYVVLAGDSYNNDEKQTYGIFWTPDDAISFIEKEKDADDCDFDFFIEHWSGDTCESRFMCLDADYLY